MSAQSTSRRPKPGADATKKGRGGPSSKLPREEERTFNLDSIQPPQPPQVPVHGSGKFIFPNGSVYCGEWQIIDDVKRRHGYGRLQNGNEIYIGYWKDDMMHGHGRFEFASGNVYEGQWAAGQFHGLGTYTWANGAVYTGKWCKNKMHGDGVLITPSKDRYEGTFHNNYFVNELGKWTQASELIASKKE